MNRKELIQAIVEKYEAMGQNPDTHLSGLLHAEPMTYWDFIQVDALLGLQTQRTQLKDEMVFIMYHQINELLFKMILWEVDQVSHQEIVSAEKFTKHLSRISRYFDMLSSSFTIMGDGMDVDQYMKFRDTLTPASGFQSAQYRKIEFASTELINLIDYRSRTTIDRDTPYEYAMENLYWQAAGVDHKTGEKNALLSNFEDKYSEEFIGFMKEYNTINLWTKFKTLPTDLNSGTESAAATGGSEWQKYMHPQYQRRIFYPELWSEEELENWGVTNIDGHETVTNADSLPLFKA